MNIHIDDCGVHIHKILLKDITQNCFFEYFFWGLTFYFSSRMIKLKL